MYTKFLSVLLIIFKKSNQTCETTNGLIDTIIKDLVVLATDVLFPALLFISLSWGRERDNKIKRQGAIAEAI